MQKKKHSESLFGGVAKIICLYLSIEAIDPIGEDVARRLKITTPRVNGEIGASDV
jgi:hypothetical protein